MPVRDLLDDGSGGIALVGNDFGVADGVQAVLQGVECRVKFWKGESWLNEAIGVDYQGRILIRNANPLVVQAEIGAAIADTPDVTQVVSLSFSPPGATRHASVAYSAATEEGPITATVNV